MVPHGLPCLLIGGLGETGSRFGTEGPEASVRAMGWRLGSVASDGVSPWAMVWRGQCLGDTDKGVAVSVGGVNVWALQGVRSMSGVGGHCVGV